MDQHLVTMLELVRVEGIVKMLWDNVDHDALKHSVHQVLQNENENIKAELDRMTRYQLIRVADHHLDIVTEELINQYYEQYRYGLKPGFTLYLLCGPHAEITAQQAFLQLQQRLEKIKALEEEVKKKEKALKDKEKTKKQMVLRLSPGLWNEIAAWAEEDFRSINGQVEFLLSECVKQRKKG